MSRIGKAPINLPNGVSIEVSKSNVVTVKGAKGQLIQAVDPDIKVNVEDGVLSLENCSSIRHRSFHGHTDH
ncbi:MAG: 50S ribosomal protein L6 [Saprospiraceae bacterium]